MRSVVTFHYTLRDPSGQVLDTSSGAAPVTYLEGAGQIIDGLDEQLRGAAAGLKTRWTIYEANDVPGGICRSYYTNGFHFENGGGHWVFGDTSNVPPEREGTINSLNNGSASCEPPDAQIRRLTR
jgi:hypothetical protein